MGHIHTGEGEHDLTASAFIMRTDFEEPKIMLHKHKKLGKFFQFGGHVELHENPWEALKHELTEEAGYELSQLLLLQPVDRIKHLTGAVVHPQPMSSNTHPFPELVHFHTDLEYGFVTGETPRQQVGDGESKEFAYFTRQEVVELSQEQIVENLREIILFMFDVCMVKWERVPADQI